MDKTDRERIAELLVEPNIQGMDWSLGSYVLNDWKAELPDRILTLIKQLGYTRQPEPVLTRIKCARCGQKFEQPNFQTDICGNCADDLRSEEEAKLLGEEHGQ